MELIPDETQSPAEEPSRILRAIEKLRAAPAGKRRAYAAIGAAVLTLVFVGAALTVSAIRNPGKGGVWGAGFSQLANALGGLVESATPENPL